MGNLEKRAFALPVAELVPFLWLACFCMMLAVVGLTNLLLPLGVLVALAVFALGMSTAMLPPEMLPAFWANWIAPWAPQAAIGEGVRSIIYLGDGPFVAGMPQLLVTGAVGVLDLAAAVFVPAPAPRTKHEKAPAGEAKASAQEV